MWDEQEGVKGGRLCVTEQTQGRRSSSQRYRSWWNTGGVRQSGA